MRIEDIERNPKYRIVKRGTTPNLGKEYIVVYNRRFDTYTRFYRNVLETLTENKFDTLTHQGKNVEWITRVTGYFSKVKNWNKGKLVELEERHRSNLK